MDFSLIKKITIEIPIIHLAIFAGIFTFIALIGRLKLLLLCVYGSLLYWVFILNEQKFNLIEEGNLLHTGLFILTSIIFIGCSAWVLFIER